MSFTPLNSASSSFTPYDTSAAPKTKIGSAGQTISANATPQSNVASLLGAGKGLFGLLTSAEQGFGNEIAAAAGAGGATKNNLLQSAQTSQNLQAAIKSRQQFAAQGKDTTKVDQMIQDAISTLGAGSSASDVLPAVNDTPKDVALNAGGVALDIASAGTYGSAAKTAETGKLLRATPTVISATKQGTSAATDYLADRSAQNEAASIAKEITPTLTPSKLTAAGKAGQLAEPTLTKAGGVSSQAPAIQRAVKSIYGVAARLGTKAIDIVKPGASATSNVNRVISTISKYSQDVVKPFLSKNPVATNFESFIDYMKNVKPSTAIQNSSEANKAFSSVRERIIQSVYSSVKTAATKAGDFGASTDMNDYWGARKTIDDIIEEELGAKTLADPARTGIKAAAKTLRTGVADFISDALRFPGQGEQVAVFRNTVNGLKEKGFDLTKDHLTTLAHELGLNPSGEAQAVQWDAHMQDMSNLYNARDSLLTKAVKEQGKTSLQLLAKNHPLITRALKYGVGALGAGALFKEGQSISADL